jgi:hypothetical protein
MSAHYNLFYAPKQLKPRAEPVSSAAGKAEYAFAPCGKTRGIRGFQKNLNI